MAKTKAKSSGLGWGCFQVEDECDCAKCADPVAYQEWKEENPDEYQDWLASQMEYEDYD